MWKGFRAAKKSHPHHLGSPDHTHPGERQRIDICQPLKISKTLKESILSSLSTRRLFCRGGEVEVWSGLILRPSGPQELPWGNFPPEFCYYFICEAESVT